MTLYPEVTSIVIIISHISARSSPPGMLRKALRSCSLMTYLGVTVLRLTPASALATPIAFRNTLNTLDASALDAISALTPGALPIVPSSWLTIFIRRFTRSVYLASVVPVARILACASPVSSVHGGKPSSSSSLVIANSLINCLTRWSVIIL